MGAQQVSLSEQDFFSSIESAASSKGRAPPRRYSKSLPLLTAEGKLYKVREAWDVASKRSLLQKGDKVVKKRASVGSAKRVPANGSKVSLARGRVGRGILAPLRAA